MHNPYIIYLNGPSSAGKTTLARALQNALPQPFLILGIDQIISMMPDKLNDWTNDTVAPGFSWQPVTNQQGNITAYKIVIGDFGNKIVRAFKDIYDLMINTHKQTIDKNIEIIKQHINQKLHSNLC